MPHKNEYHLPSDLTWKIVYESYCSRSNLQDPATYQMFVKHMNGVWSNITIAPAHSLGSCDVCNDFNSKANGLRTEEELSPDEIRTHAQHLQDQEDERYYPANAFANN